MSASHEKHAHAQHHDAHQSTGDEQTAEPVMIDPACGMNVVAKGGIVPVDTFAIFSCEGHGRRDDFSVSRR